MKSFYKIFYKYLQSQTFLGQCVDVGKAKGIAYLATNEICPWKSSPTVWQNALTGKYMEDATLIWGIFDGTTSDNPNIGQVRFF